MSDPFAAAAERIVHKIGVECIHTSYATTARTPCYAVLDKDVEVFDELGNLVERDDMISLLKSEVGTPKTRDTVIFDSYGESYTLGRTMKDDGYVIKMLAHKS